MANLKYRVTTTPTLPGSTTAKGTPLDNLEGDANLKSISNHLDLLTTNTSITDDLLTAVEVFPMWALAPTATNGTGAVPYRISTTKLRYIPSTDTLIAANFQGNAATVTTNANLTGEVTSIGNATTVTNASVIGKQITGFTSGAGTINGTDTILSAIQKLNGNVSFNASEVEISGKTLTGYSAVGTAALPTSASTILSAIVQLAYNDTLTGEVTRTAGTTAATVTNTAVIGKVITGYTAALASTAVADTDTILVALAKMAPKASPALVTPTITTNPAVNNNSSLIASTGWYVGQTADAVPLTAAATGVIGTSLKWAKQDHVHPDARPTFRAHLLTTPITYTSGAAAAVTIFNTKTGVGGFENVSASYNITNGRWTPGQTGLYQLTTCIRLTGTTITDATVSFVLNGASTATVLSTNKITGVSVTELTMALEDIVSLNATDTIEVRLTVTGTGTLNGNIGTEKTYFAGTMVSRA